MSHPQRSLRVVGRNGKTQKVPYYAGRNVDDALDRNQDIIDALNDEGYAKWWNGLSSKEKDKQWILHKKQQEKQQA